MWQPFVEEKTKTCLVLCGALHLQRPHFEPPRAAFRPLIALDAAELCERLRLLRLHVPRPPIGWKLVQVAKEQRTPQHRNTYRIEHHKEHRQRLVPIIGRDIATHRVISQQVRATVDISATQHEDDGFAHGRVDEKQERQQDVPQRRTPLLEDHTVFLYSLLLYMLDAIYCITNHSCITDPSMLTNLISYRRCLLTLLHY